MTTFGRSCIGMAAAASLATVVHGQSFARQLLGPPDSIDVYPADCSIDGTIIVGNARTPSGLVGLIWDSFGNLIAERRGASFYSISDDGSTIGALVGTDYVRIRDGVDIPMPVRAGGRSSQIRGLSGDGRAVLGGEFAWSEVAGFWLGEDNGRPTQNEWGISGDGEYVVGWIPDAGGNGTLPARWSAANGWQRLAGFPANGGGQAIGATQDGSAILVEHPALGLCMWRESTGIVGVDAERSVSFLSRDGRVIGGSRQNPWAAFLWTEEGGNRSLTDIAENSYGVNVYPWELMYPVAVSADVGIVVAQAQTCGRLTAVLLRLDGPASCRSDFNYDGFLDFFDYDSFVTAFEAGSPDADFNRDCFADFFDYDAFVEAFEHGC
jgi:hypothetical protein